MHLKKGSKFHHICNLCYVFSCSHSKFNLCVLKLRRREQLNSSSSADWLSRPRLSEAAVFSSLTTCPSSGFPEPVLQAAQQPARHPEVNHSLFMSHFIYAFTQKTRALQLSVCCLKETPPPPPCVVPPRDIVPRRLSSRRFVKTGRRPLVFIVSDSLSGDSSSRFLFPREVQEELDISSIRWA